MIAHADGPAPDDTRLVHSHCQRRATGAQKVSMRLGADTNADAVITASPPEILRRVSGTVTLRQVVKRGPRVDGSRAAVERIVPERPPADAT